MDNQKNLETALLVMDFQNGILSRIEKPDRVLENVNKAISFARESGIKVIFITILFRPGYPEIKPGNPLLDGLKQTKVVFTEGHESTAIVPSISVEPDDIIIGRARISAFTGTDLDLILGANGITSLILAGISTNGVVLSTLREATDKDYQVKVLSDACADPDQSVHDFLVEKVFPFTGSTLTTEEWTSAS